ncbi:MAG: V-type ATP synthase subunit B [Actinobacteria bacterium]|nr:MAG: V-type ATP synthase subunit B [Actinomycetota bacterium]
MAIANKEKETPKLISLVETDYKTVNYVSGPLLFLKNVKGLAYNEMVHILCGNGEIRNGQVLECTEDFAAIQVFEGTQGIDVDQTSVRFLAEVAKIDVSIDLLGRVLNGRGDPIDGGPRVLPEARLEITGSPINPFAREKPEDFIQTGVSCLDGLNTLVRGQKLPIFSGAGLPANELTAQIIRQAKVKSGEQFAVVFAAMGITHREASFFRWDFERTGALDRVVFFLNLADDPTIERIITPRCALTVAEYLAFNYDMHILVVLTDMTNYCEALREVSTAREEVPGRRGYPGYMYTDLAEIYERAGRLKNKKGSITQLVILTMPDDDITHPIPDLTGYITEGQIVLGRHLHRRGIFPPIDVLPCLSRLMNQGIGSGKTREDHRNVADQLYASYARGRDLRKLVSIIGEEALSEEDRKYLKFADDFEQVFVSQGDEDREIERTLEISWDLFSMLPKSELKRIKHEFLDKYLVEREGTEEEVAGSDSASADAKATPDKEAAKEEAMAEETKEQKPAEAPKETKKESDSASADDKATPDEAEGEKNLAEIVEEMKDEVEKEKVE